MGMDGNGPVEIHPPPERYGEGLKFIYANGVKMIGQSAGNRGVKFEGTDGWIFIHIHGGKLEAEPASILDEKVELDIPHSEQNRDAHQRIFLNAVKKRLEPNAPVEVGHRTASLCHLLNIAMLTGRKLKWNPDKEQILNDSQAAKMLVSPMRSPWKLSV